MKENELYPLKKFRKAIATNNSNYIYGLHKYKRVEYSLQILEQDSKFFVMGKNYDYLLGTIPWLYDIKSYSLDKRKEAYLRIQKIRYKIKTYLLEEKNSKENRYNYKIFNKILGKLEVLSLSIYKAQDKEELDVLRYFIFEIKNISLVKDIIKNKPHQINLLDEQSMNILKDIIEEYISRLKEHVKITPFNHFDDLLYYDRVLSIITEHEKDHFTMKELRIIYDLFAKASVENNYIGIAKDRYAYFIEKWKTTFQNFMIAKIAKRELSYSKELSREELFYQYDITPEFSLGTKAEATSMYLNRMINPLKPSKKYVYTVDSEGAEELDDGFSLEKEGDIYTLGIHVSNPIYDVRHNSKILEEILRRVYSYYLYEQTIYLYPELLGKDLFSLKEKNVRSVLSLYTKIDKVKRKIISQEYKMENVEIEKNDTYEECNRALLTNDNSMYKETLLSIQEILPVLTSLYSLDPMYSLVARKEPNITHTNITGTTTSEKMIESFMIFFNSSFANLAREYNIPFIYRNHILDPLYQKDCEYYLERLKKENCTGFYIDELKMLKFMYPNSYYDTFSRGHAGLGVKNYCHISSAARRAGDNLNLLMLEKYFFSQESQNDRKKDLKKLRKYAAFFNEQQSNMKGFTSEYYSLVRRK